MRLGPDGHAIAWLDAGSREQRNVLERGPGELRIRPDFVIDDQGQSRVGFTKTRKELGHEGSITGAPGFVALA